MLYEWTFTIPFNTTQVDPVKRQLPLHVGVIVAVEIFNPPGSNRLCRSQIWRMLNCVWPSNKDGYTAADGIPIRWQAYYELTDEPYMLELRAWNLDDTYDHDVIVRINILPKAVASLHLVMQEILDTFRRLFRV